MPPPKNCMTNEPPSGSTCSTPQSPGAGPTAPHAAIAATHRPAARFMLIGHTHRPGVWTTPSGLTVINTGSLSRPFGALAVDLNPTQLTVRRIVARAGNFLPGPVIAEFALAETPASAKIPT